MTRARPLHILISLACLPCVACGPKQGSQSTAPSSDVAHGSAASEGVPASGASGPSRARGVTGTRDAGKREKGQLRLASDEPPRPGEEDDLGQASGDGKLGVDGIVPNAAVAGTMIEVFGHGFSPDPAKNKVSAGGKAWKVVKVGSDRLLAIVPNGAEDGRVKVEVGASKVVSKAAFRVMASDAGFGVDASTRNGLLGDVYAAGGEVRELPDFSSFEAPHSVFAVGALNLGSGAGPPGVLGPQTVASHNFAVRFTGSLNVLGADEYELCLSGSDGSRLFLEDTAVLESPGVHGPEQVCELVFLEAGEYDLMIEYFKGPSGPASLQFLWGRGGAAPSIVPAEVLFRPARHTSVPGLSAVESKPGEDRPKRKKSRKASGSPRAR
ncbi:MAG: PA14 domain-containing protein [Nannocystaceae bacterium]